jgi:membrane-bound acyltransferase YfiQ involved in biofilm formation
MVGDFRHEYDEEFTQKLTDFQKLTIRYSWATQIAFFLAAFLLFSLAYEMVRSRITPKTTDKAAS